METISYAQVQTLVTNLPASKLPLAYRLLQALLETEAETISPQEALLRLPVAARHEILAEQAAAMKQYYEQIAVERETWQGGDFTDVRI